MSQKLSDAVGELAAMAVADFDEDELLTLLCRVASQSLNADGVGVMKVVAGASCHVQSSEPDFARMGRLQETLQQGPCLDAIAAASVISAQNRSQMAWPAFEDLADQVGVKAVMVIPLISRSRSWGSLDLYWRSDHLISDQERQQAALLARVAVSYLALAAERVESREVQQQLTHRSLHDELTGLPNRGLLQGLIDHAVASAKRRKTLVAAIFLDIDFFKSVNDSFGHRVGDQVLQVVAHRVKNLLRGGDTVGRLGGDEFLILCEDINTGHHAKAEITALAEAIRAALTEPITLQAAPDGRAGAVSIIVSASVGVALTEEHHCGAELIHSADTAMYEAKAQGRDRVVISQDLSGGADRRHQLERRLFQAADRDELTVHYQPILSPIGNQIAVEALVRWQHPELGLLPATEFLDLARSTGSIVAIGLWVIDQALQQLRQWQRAFPRVAPQIVFINVSRWELISHDFLLALNSAVNRHGLRPGNIGIEVQENSLADSRLRPILSGLHQRGYLLAIDNFGTGYSSLSALVNLPVDYIKIDRTITAKLPADPGSAAMIKAVLALATDLNLQVVGEGIENQLQADHLTQAGTHLLQGFHYAHPMNAAQLTQQLANLPRDVTPEDVCAGRRPRGPEEQTEFSHR